MLALLVVMLAASITAISGNGDALPLDSHEIFVARTAEEMFARNSLIVPFNNDEPRVKKPPLAYWMVMWVDAVHDRDRIISEWEARIPSIASGILLAMTTCILGFLLFDVPTGLLAGLFIASCGGYIQYTHSARPEMLYASCCTAAMLAFARARHATNDSSVRPLLAAWTGWFRYGLAMLAKGPHLPALMLIGTVIAGVREEGWRNTRRWLRPWTGLIVLLAVSLWWFVLVQVEVPQSGATWSAETLSRFFNSDQVPWTTYFDPYYLYRTSGLALPWIVLYPLAVAAPLLPFMRGNPSVRRLWWVFIVPLVLLHVSLGRRWYYMLPVMAPMTLMISWGVLQLGRMMLANGSMLIWRLAWIGHVIVLVLAMAWVWQTAPPGLRPPVWAPWTMLIGASIALKFILRSSTSTTMTIAQAPVATALLAVVFLAGAAARGTIWGSDRFDDRELSRRIGEVVPAGDALFGWQTDWETVQYYNHRVIPSPARLSDLRTLLQTSLDRSDVPAPAHAWLLVGSRKTVNVPDEFAAEVALRFEYSDRRHSVDLLRVTTAGR